MAFTSSSKIKKTGAPTPLESQVATYLFDLENNASKDLKAQLKALYITSAKEVDLGDGNKAVVVFVPYRLLTQFHKVQERVVGELEKKLSGQTVVILAQRTILAKPSKNNRKAAQKRPYSRTLTAVHAAILDDLVFPSEVVGRRIRVKVDGTRTQKVQLDTRAQQEVEHKLETLSGVYKRMTGKEVNFVF